MREDYKLSFVFCAVNETNSLISCHKKISNYNYATEYLFVLSKNATKDCIQTVKSICKKNNNCRYIFQSDYGLGNAIRNAIDEVKGSHIIIWPADDGMDTESIPKMVELSMNNPKKIISVSRWLKKDGFEGYGRIRKTINYFSQRIFSLLYKSDLTDFTNPTQIAPVSIYRSIKWQGNAWDFIPEMIFKPLKLGCEFIEVPCKNLKRTEGKSNSNFFQLAKYYIIILKIYNMTEDELTERIN